LILKWIENIIELIFPQMCMLCDTETVIGKKNKFCLACKINMPYTDHFKNLENMAFSRLRGRVPAENVASLLNFFSYSDVKLMIHKLKYENRRDIGLQLGKMAGQRAKKSPFFKDIDFIIPIPLHKSRLRKRGYNQAYLIAQGISEEIGVPIRQDIVLKIKNTKSQTSMNREERIQNVYDSFKLENSEIIKGKHILIVDDVLTTGSTIQACSQRMLLTDNVRISVITATIARG